MPRNIALDDFMNIQVLSDPRVTPDGRRVACVVKRIDPEKNRYLSAVWIAPTGFIEDEKAGHEPYRFTSAESSARHPRWSPDGKRLAFLSDRQKPLNQIYLMPADGGEAWALTALEMEGSIGTFCWSPDGSKIAFTFRATPEAYRKEPTEERKKKELSSPVRHHTRLFYRLDGLGYIDDAYSQVWVADAHTGAASPLTSGPYDCDSLAWSPDSRTLAFLSDRRDDRDISPAHDALYTVDIASLPSLPAAPSPSEAEGTASRSSAQDVVEPPLKEREAEEELEKGLTSILSPPGTKTALAWSPNGTHFAYVGNPDPLDTWGTTNERVFLLPVSGGETAQDLTGHTDWSVGYLTLSDSHELGTGDLLQWSLEGKDLYFAASLHGNTCLCRVDVATREVLRLTEEGEVGSFHVRSRKVREEQIVYSIGTATLPHELVAYRAENRRYHWTTLTFNQAWQEEIRIVLPEALEIENGSGGKIPGWLLKPTDFVEGEKYPLVVYVHGGPHTQYGNTFFHELQFLAASGYVVLYTNPRGSKGYGEAHTKAIVGNWGSVDYEDIMTATDYAAGLDYVDADRMAIMGGSYGGFMTAWAIGHTDRFRCAIADRLVANLHSMSGTCDFPWKPDAYYKGNGWSDPTQLWRCSPLAYAGNINTPLLLIHSDGDLRCPAGQAEEMFAALRLQRKTVEYVRYPAEGSHGLSRNGPPDLRRDRLRRNLDWLDRWLKPGSGTRFRSG